MTLSGQNFEMHQGDNKEIIITNYDENDAILDLTGYSIVWVAYHPTTKALILSKSLGDGITVPTPENGQIVISLLPADTLSVVPNTYNHEVEITLSSVVSTTTTGTIKILFSKA